MPIDDVWLTGEPVGAVPVQRAPRDGQPAVTTARELPRNGAQTEQLPRNGNQGSNGANMTPQNRNNGSTNGSENGGIGGIGPTHTFEPHDLDSRTSSPRTFDPKTFDPGPDLPPLPTLRPLPTIRPLNRWPLDPPPLVPPPAEPPSPVVPPAAQVAPTATPATVDSAAGPQPVPGVQRIDEPAGPSRGTEPATFVERRAAHRHHHTDAAADRVTGFMSAPLAPATQPVRHRRRATDLPEPVPETVIGTWHTSAAAPTVIHAPSAQRVLVVGGSGAIGSAVARAMAAQGARVAVHHASHAVEAVELVAALPGEGHLSIGADLADSEAVADLIRSVSDKFDGIDVVINAATAGEAVSRASVVGSSLADWTDAWTGTLTVDVLGAATVAHAAAAAFMARGHGGRIILLAAKGRPFSGIPNPVGLATEQAVAALGSVLAGELSPYGIGVIVVGSGSAASSGWSPTALAETVAWLASGPTSALPGAVFNIAG